MSDIMETQKRFFAVQLERARKRPGVQREKIKDCEMYIGVLDGCSTPLEFKQYVQQNANMLSMGKAEAKDRYNNFAFIYEKLGQEKKVRANRERIGIIDRASTHAGLAEALETFETENTLTMEENKAIMGASGVWKAVFRLATEPKGYPGYDLEMNNFHTYRKMALEGDPDFGWEKMVNYPPYRDRVPFTDKQIAMLKPAYEEAANGSDR